MAKKEASEKASHDNTDVIGMGRLVSQDLGESNAKALLSKMLANYLLIHRIVDNDNNGAARQTEGVSPYLKSVR